MTPAGFPHSDICGSTVLCTYSQRFVAYTSFIGNLSLGIHHTPSVALFIQRFFLRSVSFTRSLITALYETFKMLSATQPKTDLVSVGKEELYQPGLPMSRSLGTFQDKGPNSPPQTQIMAHKDLPHDPYSPPQSLPIPLLSPPVQPKC